MGSQPTDKEVVLQFVELTFLGLVNIRGRNCAKFVTSHNRLASLFTPSDRES
jgi:hypothetical protein